MLRSVPLVTLASLCAYALPVDPVASYALCPASITCNGQNMAIQYRLEGPSGSICAADPPFYQMSCSFGPSGFVCSAGCTPDGSSAPAPPDTTPDVPTVPPPTQPPIDNPEPPVDNPQPPIDNPQPPIVPPIDNPTTPPDTPPVDQPIIGQ